MSKILALSLRNAVDQLLHSGELISGELRSHHNDRVASGVSMGAVEISIAGQTDFSGMRLQAVSKPLLRYPQVIIKERELLPKLNIRHDRTNGTLSLRHRSGVHLEMGLKGLALSAEF